MSGSDEPTDSNSAEEWLHRTGGRDAAWHRDRRSAAEQAAVADRLPHQRAALHAAEMDEDSRQLSEASERSRETPPGRVQTTPPSSSPTETRGSGE